MSGFSLIELLIVIALFTSVGVFMFPMSLSLYFVQVLDETQSEVLSTLRTAQMSALTQKNDSSFGVGVFDGSVILFEGASYEYRDQSKDFSFSLPNNMTYVGPNEIVYQQGTGRPLSTSTLVFQLTGKTATITVSSLGIAR